MVKTLGKVAGGIGLLLTLTSFVTFFLASPLAFAIKLGLGIALLIFWAVTNGERLGTWTKSVFFYGSSAMTGVVLIALLVAANYIVAKRGASWDLTDKKIYSLSAQTTQTLKSLSEPVKAFVFVAGPAPDSIDNLFRRYAQETRQLSFELKDPRKTPDLTAKYNVKDVSGIAVLVRGLGTPNESHTTANLATLATAGQGEQELTNALIRLTKVGEQKVYFTVGHGEWPLDPGENAPPEALVSSLQKLKVSLIAEGYSPDSLNLAEAAAIPNDAAVVIIAGPKSAFQSNEKALLEQYLEEGGRLLYFGDPAPEPGLDALLASYGVQLDNGMVADARVNPEQPYLIIAPFFSDHPIVEPIKTSKLNLLFPMTRALTQLREGLKAGVTVTPLVLTTPNAWVETKAGENPVLDEGEKSGQLPVAMASTRESLSHQRTSEARLVVFGTSQLLNGAWAYEPNRNLVLNALGWASNQPKKLTIRPPDRDISTLDIDDSRLATIRFISMDVLPMLLIGVGLTIWLTRRSR